LLLLVGEDASQALEVSTGAVRINHHVANSPPSVKEEGNLQEFIDSNPFTQLGSTQIEAEESQALHMNNTDSIAENDTQDMRAEGNDKIKLEDSDGTEEVNHEDTEVGSPRGFYQANTHQGSDSRASTDQEPPFDLYGEDTLDGMGESRDNSRKAFGVSQTMDAELQRYNSTLSGVMGTENSTQADGGDEETESQKRVEKQFGDKKDKKDRKERKKDKKDRKERKKEKHDKHNDPEYLEKKRKRKEEREQRRGQEGHKSSKEEKHRKEDRSVKVEEKSASDAPINDYLQPEGTKIENQGGTDTMKIKFKFKKPRTAT
jgi:hypothetical protein